MTRRLLEEIIGKGRKSGNRHVLMRGIKQVYLKGRVCRVTEIFVLLYLDCRKDRVIDYRKVTFTTIKNIFLNHKNLNDKKYILEPILT